MGLLVFGIECGVEKSRPSVESGFIRTIYTFYNRHVDKKRMLKEMGVLNQERVLGVIFGINKASLFSTIAPSDRGHYCGQCKETRQLSTATVFTLLVRGPTGLVSVLRVTYLWTQYPHCCNILWDSVPGKYSSCFSACNSPATNI